MKPIAAMTIIHTNGNGSDVLVNNVIAREIERQRLNYEEKMRKLTDAIEGRDRVDIERHKILGRKLAELQEQMKPKKGILRAARECCIFVFVGLVAVGQYLIGR